MRTIVTLLLFSAVLSSSALSAQVLTHEEAELLNEHFKAERDEFDFTNKKVGFFFSGAVWTKEEFFEQLNQRNLENANMSNQFIMLSETQKAKSGGYDVFIISWSKFSISPEKLDTYVERIKSQTVEEQ